MSNDVKKLGEGQMGIPPQPKTPVERKVTDIPKPEAKAAAPKEIETIVPPRPPETAAGTDMPSIAQITAAHSAVVLDDAEPTAEEIAAVKAKVRARMNAERIKAKLKMIEQEEERRLRDEEGLTEDAGPGGDLVNIMLDLAPFADRLVVDGRIYMTGQTHTVKRRVAASLAEMQYNGWKHQLLSIEGKSLTDYYQRNRDTRLTPRGAINAPKPFDR